MLGVLARSLPVAVAAVSGALAQEGDAALAPPPYQLLRFNEDYSSLADPAKRTDVWDPLKYIPLSDSGDLSLSFGGEARLRYERYDNYRWDPASPDQDGYLLQRYLVHADLRVGDSLRLFSQLQASLENWRAGGPRPTDENRLDVHQLFADIRLWSGASDETVTLRAGREEMSFGSQRLISVRESPNIRRAFDAVHLLVRLDDWRIDAFLSRPVEDDSGSFDDWGEDGTSFWGFYATHPLPILPGAKLDLYYLGLRRPDAAYVQGVADELRHSIGARLFGEQGGWDYNFESLVQFGTFGDADILAWTLGTDTGCTFASVPLRPRLGLRADVISGGSNANSGRLGTFNPLFPKGAYFGEIALIGPANLFDVHPTLDLHVTEQFTVSVDWDIFWRYSTDDGLYDNGGNVLRDPAGSDARFVGHQPGFSLEWEIGRHTTLSASYAHFFAGDFIKQSGAGADVDFVAVWLTYKF